MYKPFQVTTSTILKGFSLNNQSSITYQLISLRFFIYWILTNYTPMIYVIYFSKSACSAFSNRSCYFDILSRKNEFIMQTGWNFTFTTKPLCLCFFVLLCGQLFVTVVNTHQKLTHRHTSKIKQTHPDSLLKSRDLVQRELSNCSLYYVKKNSDAALMQLYEYKEELWFFLNHGDFHFIFCKYYVTLLAVFMLRCIY